MTKATADVNKKGCFGLQTLSDTLLHGVESFVTPAALPLAVSAHVIIELFCVFGALSEPDEERILRFMRELEGPVGDVSRVAIASLLQVGRDGVQRWSSHIVALRVELAQSLVILKLGLAYR